MGRPLKEQLNNPHSKAGKHCEGCYGSGWLTAQVDNPDILAVAGLDELADFLMNCGECELFDSDEDAAIAARKAGMEVSYHLVVAYTGAQLDFLGIEPIEDPKSWLIHQLGGYLEGIAETGEIPQLLGVSCDGDNTSASIIVDVLTPEGVRSLYLSTSGIKDVDDE